MLDPIGLLPPAQADEHPVTSEIRQALRAGDLRAARNLAERWLGENPVRWEALLWAAWIELRQGNSIPAIRLLRRAEQVRTCPAVAKLLAVAYYFQRQHKLFELKLQEVMKAAPDDFAPFYLLGRFYEVELGDLAKAEEYFRAALLRNPGHYLSHYYLGLCLESRGRLEEAERHYRNALRQAQGAGVAAHLPYVGLASLHHLRGRHADGLRLARRAVELGERDPRSHKVLASLLAGLGRHREAAVALERAVSLDPADVAAHYRLFQAYKAAGEAGKARLALERYKQVYAAYGDSP